MPHFLPDLPPSWQEALANELTQHYFTTLDAFLRQEYTTHRCYPAPHQLFAAFEACTFDQVRVVILGQDPYHGPQQAEGLAFSVPEGVKPPPSLRNILREVADDLGQALPLHGSLRHWAAQGVLLLNTTLSVRQGEPLSHAHQGWERFTTAALRALATRRDGLVFLLWGAQAQQHAPHLCTQRHLVLTAPHPSPLSAHRGFFGQHHFSRANAYLRAQGLRPISW